jgi:hypothetical protein
MIVRITGVDVQRDESFGYYIDPDGVLRSIGLAQGSVI